MAKGLGIVYSYTDITNGKKYIGRTINPPKRHRQHIDAGGGKDGTIFHDVVINRGCMNNKELFEQNFVYEVLYSERFDSDIEDRRRISKVLDDKEAEFIQQFNTVYPNGYNEQSYSTTTIFSLTPKQIEKQKESAKHTKHKKSRKYEQFYYNNIETPEERELRIERKREASKKVWERPEKVAYREECKIRKEEKRQEKLRKREEYQQTDEYKAHIQEVRKCEAERITAYNKSEKHRQDAIRSNQNRWKDGCPEETRNKMSDSARKVAERRKGQRWMNKDGETKMVVPAEINKYINDGWSFGRI